MLPPDLERQGAWEVLQQPTSSLSRGLRERAIARHDEGIHGVRYQQRTEIRETQNRAALNHLIVVIKQGYIAKKWSNRKDDKGAVSTWNTGYSPTWQDAHFLASYSYGHWYNAGDSRNFLDIFTDDSSRQFIESRVSAREIEKGPETITVEGASESFSVGFQGDWKGTDLGPGEMVELICRHQSLDPDWLNAFVELLCKRVPGVPLTRVLEVWGLTERELGAIYGASEETVKEWLSDGIPSEMLQSMSDLSAATDLLIHYLKRDRIPAVVRRPMERFSGRSLVDLLTEKNTGTVLEACRDMFDFESVHG